MPRRRLFLSILQGETPRSAVPLIATEDVEIIRLVGYEIARRLGASAQVQGVLRLLDGEGDSRNGNEKRAEEASDGRSES